MRTRLRRTSSAPKLGRNIHCLKGHPRLSFVLNHYKSGCALDVGSGEGAFSLALLQQRCRVTMLDILPVEVPDSRIAVRQASVFEIEDKAEYDTILFMEIIEHVEEVEEAIGRCVRALKVGGRLLITTPHVSDWDEEPDHIWRFDLDGVEELLKDYDAVVWEDETFVYAVVTKTSQRILVWRGGKHGDVIASTSVLPGLRAKYPRPDAVIHFHTRPEYYWVMENNPHIDTFAPNPVRESYDEMYNPEHRWNWYMQMPRQHCGVCGVEFSSPELYVESNPEFVGAIAVAGLAGVASRSYMRMAEVIEELPEFRFVQVGQGDRLPCEHVGKHSLREVASIMEACDTYVGVDTVFMHMAIALGKPMVLLLGPTTHEFQWLPNASLLYSKNRPSLDYGVLTGQHESIDVEPSAVVGAIRGDCALRTDEDGELWQS